MQACRYVHVEGTVPCCRCSGVVWVLTRSLLFVAVMLALLVSAGVAYAQGTPTVPTIESVAVTSDPGEDGGYAIDDEIQVGLTFSEAVTVTGVPQLTLDVGGRIPYGRILRRQYHHPAAVHLHRRLGR